MQCYCAVLLFIIFPDFIKYEVIVLRKIRNIIEVIILYLINCISRKIIFADSKEQDKDRCKKMSNKIIIGKVKNVLGDVIYVTR